MTIEQYQKWCLTRIAKGHSVVLKKGVPKKKSPTGKAIPAVTKRVPGVVSKILLGRTAQIAMSADEGQLEMMLMRLRKARVLVCTNGMWWAPK